MQGTIARKPSGAKASHPGSPFCWWVLDEIENTQGDAANEVFPASLVVLWCIPQIIFGTYSPMGLWYSWMHAYDSSISHIYLYERELYNQG